MRPSGNSEYSYLTGLSETVVVVDARMRVCCIKMRLTHVLSVCGENKFLKQPGAIPQLKASSMITAILGKSLTYMQRRPG